MCQPIELDWLCYVWVMVDTVALSPLSIEMSVLTQLPLADRSSRVVEPLVIWPARKPKPLVILVTTLSVVAEPVDLSFTMPEEVWPLLQVSVKVPLAMTVPAAGAALQLAGPVVLRVAFEVPPVTWPVQPLDVVVEVIVLSVVLLLVWLMGGLMVDDPVTVWAGQEMITVEAVAGPAKARRPAVATAPARHASGTLRNKVNPPH